MKTNDEWRTIEPGVWRPENEDDRITGVLVSKGPKDEAAGTRAR